MEEINSIELQVLSDVDIEQISGGSGTFVRWVGGYLLSKAVDFLWETSSGSSFNQGNVNLSLATNRL